VNNAQDDFTNPLEETADPELQFRPLTAVPHHLAQAKHFPFLAILAALASIIKVMRDRERVEVD